MAREFDEWFMKMICRMALVVWALVFVACGRNGASDQNDKPIITVSIDPQKQMLQSIVGDKIDVVSFMPPGVNPENFDPQMSVMKNVSKSRAYFRIGQFGFENAVVDKVLKNHPEILTVDTSEGIELIKGTHSHYDGTGEHSDELDVDPHVWSSIKNARVITRNMYEAVVELDPANKDFYEANYRKFNASLDSLDCELTSVLEPCRGMAFLVWHPSLSYFAKDYDLHQISLGQENKEMSVRSLRDKINEAKEHAASVFFTQSDIDEGKAEPIIGQVDVETYPINLLDYDWSGQLRNVASKIVENGAGKEK